MEQLFDFQEQILSSTPPLTNRYLDSRIDWSNRLLAVKGARGAGKTSLLLKKIKESYRNDPLALFCSLDHLYFSLHSLAELADSFQKKGGTILFLDEVHKYPNWSQEIKNIHDTYRGLKVVFTGSSILDILKGNADLSRRAVIYDLQGLSFREFLEFETGMKLDPYPLPEIFHNHREITRELNARFKPLVHFTNYLKYGYYPFYKEGVNSYALKLMNVINLTIESDLPMLKNVDPKYVPRLKKLLYLISVTAPMQPNISKLSQMIEISRNTVQLYLDYLCESRLINLSRSAKSGYAVLAKPEKIYLHNTNLAYVISKDKPDPGNLRETFFFNQVSVDHEIHSPGTGDFIIDGQYTVEVGGKSKKAGQVKGITGSFIVADDIEYGYENKIPLWLFGFTY